MPEIKRGYKLFEQDTEGTLYALFIDKKTPMPIGKMLKAGRYPTKGFAVRPGFHIGEIPSAPWLCSRNGTYTSQRSKCWKRVWAEVEYVANIDYTEDAQNMPHKCFQDELPINGYYKFRETGCNRIWIIADQMRIVRILSEEERLGILDEMGYDEKLSFEPYRIALEKRMKEKENVKMEFEPFKYRGMWILKRKNRYAVESFDVVIHTGKTVDACKSFIDDFLNAFAKGAEK